MSKYIWLLVLSPIAFLLDQWTKYLAVFGLTSVGKLGLGWTAYFNQHHLLGSRTAPYVLLPFWKFVYAENPGAAWSFLASSDASWRMPFFYLVAIVAIGMIVYFTWQTTPEMTVRRIGLSMLLGGAMGNTLDRVVHGYVIDFILWHYDHYEFPVFNVADSFVTVGVALLLAEPLFMKKPIEATASDSPSAPTA